MLKIKYDHESGKIYAYKQLKKGKSNSTEVTDEAILEVLKYIVDMKTTGDFEEVIEVERPIYKYQHMPYRIEIKLIPTTI